MHGHGVYNWEDGRKYDGDYFENVKQGKGTLTWPDGKIYSGGWFEGK